jgi:hypothetical protein
VIVQEQKNLREMAQTKASVDLPNLIVYLNTKMCATITPSHAVKQSSSHCSATTSGVRYMHMQPRDCALSRAV